MVPQVSNFPEWLLPVVRNIQAAFSALGTIEAVKTPKTVGSWGKRKKTTDLNRRSEEIGTQDVPA